jgi:hypothetical protein
MTRVGITPPTPPTLPNFLENTLVPYRFKSVGGVGGVIQHGLLAVNLREAVEPTRSVLFPSFVVNVLLKSPNYETFDH